MQPEPAKFETPRFDPIDIAIARERWTKAFDTLLLAMMTPEMATEPGKRQVSICADLADEALSHIEARWGA